MSDLKSILKAATKDLGNGLGAIHLKLAANELSERSLSKRDILEICECLERGAVAAKAMRRLARLPLAADVPSA